MEKRFIIDFIIDYHYKITNLFFIFKIIFILTIIIIYLLSLRIFNKYSYY